MCTTCLQAIRFNPHRETQHVQCYCVCLKAFVVSLVFALVPGKVSFKLHLCRQQLPNLLSIPCGVCEVIVNGVIRFGRLLPLLTTARFPPESKDPSSTAICWIWTRPRHKERRHDVRSCDSFQQWTKTGTPVATEPVGRTSTPPAMDGSTAKKVSSSRCFVKTFTAIRWVRGQRLVWWPPVRGFLGFCQAVIAAAVSLPWLVCI